jgi:hypothetical protein
MALALRSLGVEFDEIDVDADPGLEARFGERVPVLTDARGRELCHCRLDPAVVRKLIAGIK